MKNGAAVMFPLTLVTKKNKPLNTLFDREKWQKIANKTTITLSANVHRV